DGQWMEVEVRLSDKEIAEIQGRREAHQAAERQRTEADAAKEAAKQADASKRAQLLDKIARDVITEDDINLAFALSAQRRIMLGLLAQIELLRHELKIQTAARADTLPK
ncbi:MAG: hypothetical protein J0M19_16350, partial [Sphingomonadales bacterium]|nr:hypothetical protein [Sphingomonadales bacterium]